MDLDLLGLRKPAPFVRLPNGARFQLKYLDAAGFQLLRAFEADSGNVEKLAALLKECLPGASDADLDSLGVQDIQRILGKAQDKLELVEAVLKNGERGDGRSLPSPQSDSPPLSPTT